MERKILVPQIGKFGFLVCRIHPYHPLVFLQVYDIILSHFNEKCYQKATGNYHDIANMEELQKKKRKR